MKLKILFVMLAFVIISCTKGPTIDGRSQEDFDRSLKILKSEMTEVEANALDLKMNLILGMAYIREQKSFSGAQNDSTLDEIKLRLFNGKSARDIDKMAQSIGK